MMSLAALRERWLPIRHRIIPNGSNRDDVYRRLRHWLWRCQRLFERSAEPATVNVARQSASDLLNQWGRETPNPQQTLDIFKGVWTSQFPAGFGVSAGSLALFEDFRIARLIELTGGIQNYRILELGPLEGAHSCMMEKAGARSVLAIEANVQSYLKCLIVKDLLGLQRVSFRFGNFMPFLDASGERFDLIVASGVLYHQADPLRLLKLIAERTDRVFLWTHYYQENAVPERIRSTDFTPVPDVRLDGFRCDLFRLEYAAYVAEGKGGGLDEHTHWMKRDDILACLRHFGLTDIAIPFEQPVHPFGPNLTLLASRPQPSA